MLINLAPKTLVVCHNENPLLLEHSLKGMGFETEILRQRLGGAEAQYSSQAKCLLSHISAWRRVCELGSPCIVVEADFVPVKSFASLPAPDPCGASGCCAWLYSSAQRIYKVVSPDFASGQSATTVAVFWDPPAALQAIDFGIAEIERHRGSYSLWDTYLRPALKERGVGSMLIPWKSYGEHGGVPNPEHLPAGVSVSHRADALHSDLSFLPAYANGSTRHFHSVRVLARAKALARLMTGRYVEPGRFKDPSLDSSEMLKILHFATTRLFG